MKVDHGLFTNDIITLTIEDLVDLMNGKVVKGDGTEISMDRPVQIDALKALIDSALLCSKPKILKARGQE